MLQKNKELLQKSQDLEKRIQEKYWKIQELERKMKELEFEREERCRKIMHRRVQQVNTLQELGELHFITVSCRLQIRQRYYIWA